MVESAWDRMTHRSLEILSAYPAWPSKGNQRAPQPAASVSVTSTAIVTSVNASAMHLHRYEPVDASSSVTVSLPARVHDAFNVDSSLAIHLPGADSGSLSTTVAP